MDSPEDQIPAAQHRKSKYSECNKGNTQQEEANLDFLVNGYVGANELASALGIPTEWLLGWSAEESGYGRSSIRPE